MSENKRAVFFLSDRTGITAETLGATLLTQFDESEFKQSTLPFVNSAEKAHATVEYISHTATATGKRPIVFSTTVSDEVREILRGSDALFMDLFDLCLPPLEQELEVKSTHREGAAHGITDEDSYRGRIDAMNYALKHDDGLSTEGYGDAGVILIAPSRCGKTPACLYMAMQHGVCAANYPLTEEDLEKPRLPDFLRRHKKKLFGLTIDAQRLSQIREVRRPGSRYASLKQCRYEVDAAEALLRTEGVPVLSSTRASIEELGSRILLELGLQRELF